MNSSALRLSKLRHLLSQKSLDGVIITKKENVYYLTSINQPHPNNREAILFISLDQALLYHSPFLNPPVSNSIYSSQPMSAPTDLKKNLKTIFTHITQNIAIESHNLTVNELDKYQSILTNKVFNKEIDLIETIRLIKENTEINSITKACQITEKCMKWTIRYIKGRAGSISEIEASHKIEYKLKSLGADEIAFPIIVAVDANSASPHHQPGNQSINKKSVVLIDMGCKVDGYCSDMTRTIPLGKPSSRFHEIKSIVDQSYSEVIKAYTPENSASTLDNITRGYIKKQGYAKEFIHTTGHGLGLEIHEKPSLNINNHDLIQPNMTFTIEPGIYLKNTFGYRYENTVLSKKKTLEELTH